MKSGGVLQRMLRHYSPRIRARGKVIRHFASKLGLVYFGTVDQHDDDHEVVRGLTVSTTHKDAHYAVGSFDGYDISIVDRFDVVIGQDKQPVEHSWLILQVSLESRDLPHVFLNPLGHNITAYSKFIAAYNRLQIVNNVFNDVHSPEFHARYEVHSNVTHALRLEQALSSQVTQTIAAHFWPHAIEVYDGKLYVYITEHRLSETVLGSTLQSAVWLASVLDQVDQ